MPKTETITLTAEQLETMMTGVAQAAVAGVTAEQASVQTSQQAPAEPRKPLDVVFEKYEGEEAERYGDVAITKLLPNGNPRKRIVLSLDDAIRLADFVVENFDIE